MIDEKMKLEAEVMAAQADAMSDPRILITPIFTQHPDEWKRILYAYLNLTEAIQNKTNACFVVRVIDARVQEIEVPIENTSTMEKE